MKKLILGVLITALATGQVTGSAQSIFVSNILGVVADCNVHTGLTATGGTCTNNKAAITAFVAANVGPNIVLEIVMDAGVGILSTDATSAFIPTAGGITIRGLGWDTGFVALTGSTRPILWVGDNCQSSYGTCGTAPAQGNNVVLSNFTMNGTNIIGGQPPTLEPPISILSMAHVLVDHVFVEGASSYAFYFSNNADVTVRHSRVKGQIDGIHFSGTEDGIFIDDFTYFGQTGPGGFDDCIAFNAPESYAGDIKNITVRGLHCTNVRTFARIYGYYNSGNHFLVSNLQIDGGEGTNVTDSYVKLGLESGSAGSFPKTLDNITISNLRADTRKPLGYIHESFGTVSFSNIFTFPANASVLEIKSQDNNYNITGNSVFLDAKITRDSTDATGWFTLGHANIGSIVISPQSGIFLKQGYTHAPAGTAFWIANDGSTLGFLQANYPAVLQDFASPFQTVSPAGNAVRVQ